MALTKLDFMEFPLDRNGKNPAYLSSRSSRSTVALICLAVFMPT
jgi:hypothetical protein